MDHARQTLSRLLRVVVLVALLGGCATAAQRQYQTSVSNLGSEECNALQAVVEDRERYGIVAPSKDADDADLRRCRATSPAPPSSAAPSAPDFRAQEEEIPLRRQGNTYSVPVLVNGIIPIPFVLDTGAGDALLPADVVFTLLRTGTLQSSDFISRRPYVLADGRELPSAQFKIRELQVGQHMARNVIAGVGRLGSDALLGQSFLSRFGSATIDYKRNVLILSR
jgi:predicted aspartyl protease